jgi:hypothetical protein
LRALAWNFQDDQRIWTGEFELADDADQFD